MGGGTGHGEDTIEMETPAATDEVPGDCLDNRSGKEADGEESEDEDKDSSDDDDEGDIEYGDNDDDGPGVER